MPANLNALVRYKTINSCLYGGLRRWSIEELIDACSSALADTRGRYGKVSERTIRDDIRVMRSDILGFNAPIKQTGGLYYYDDPKYSILSIGITDPGLIERIIKMLLEIKKEVKHPELEIVLKKLLGMSQELPLQEFSTDFKTVTHYQRNISGEEPALKKIRIPGKARAKAKPGAAPSEPKLDEGFGPLFSFMPEALPAYSLSWGDMLAALI
jgi:hypothetical protein